MDHRPKIGIRDKMRKDQSLHISPSKLKYLEEFEKYKCIPLPLGTYHHKEGCNLLYELVSVDLENDTASLKNNKGFLIKKTPHWCRKNLRFIQNA